MRGDSETGAIAISDSDSETNRGRQGRRQRQEDGYGGEGDRGDGHQLSAEAHHGMHSHRCHVVQVPGLGFAGLSPPKIVPHRANETGRLSPGLLRLLSGGGLERPVVRHLAKFEGPVEVLR